MEGKFFRKLRGMKGIVVATVALVVMMGVFVGACTLLFRKMLEREKSDLEARAELAAAVLEEPLNTQDFKRIREFGDECRERGIQFSVNAKDGGSIYWNMRDSHGKWDWTECGRYVRKEVGEYSISVGINGTMIALYIGSVVLAALAFLVGIAGMFFVFYAFYRQRAKLAEMSRLQKERYEFVTEFTHNLKTPLTGIIAAADMMESSRLADMVKSSAHRLDQLAQDLIDVYWGRGLRGAEPANQDRGLRGAEPANQDREPANRN